MDKIAFLHWLFDRYNVSDANFEYETNRYIKGLKDNINFTKLKEYVENNCNTKPGYIELNRFATMNNYFVDITPRCNALKHIDYLKRTAARGTMKDLDEAVKVKIRNLLKGYDIIPSFDK